MCTHEVGMASARTATLLSLSMLCAAAAASAPILEVLPAAPPATQAIWANSSLDTWGGSVVQDDDGRFHIYASAMTGQCTLEQWATNSMVIHGVADSPTGPFTRAAGASGIAIPRWAHNPEVVRAPDGTFLLFSISAVNATRPCTCSQHVPSGPCRKPKLDLWIDVIQLHYSSSADGPWRSLGRVLWGSNPSPFVVPDTGEVFVAFKPGMQIARANHWRGPYKVMSKFGGLLPAAGPSFPAIEDPFLWYDAAARRWNCLFHQYAKASGAYTPRGPGGYAYSGVDNVLNWTWAVPDEGSVYGFNVLLQGEQTLTLQKRERPKLLFDLAGRPAVLYNGVEFKGRSHTFAQQIKSFAPPYAYE